MGGILSAAPFDLVNLFLDLKGLEVVELGLVGLKLGVEFVLAGFFLLCKLETAEYVATTAKPDWGGGVWKALWLLTVSFRSKRTTRPPLSPVAR